MRIRNLFLLCSLLILWSCEKDDQIPDNSPGSISSAGFISFTTDGQTLSTAINTSLKSVRLEVDRKTDVTTLVPSFNVPDGCTVFINGVQQLSGTSIVDFRQIVTYEIKDPENRTAKWNAEAVPVKLKILIDGSHDGGVWWFPQSVQTGFDAKAWHQGQPFAELLRKKGFEVDELGRGKELTEEMFFGYYIVIRAGGFEKYTSNELKVYKGLLDRGMNLVFFTDHKTYDPIDELGDYLGLRFEGTYNGTITRFKSHLITENISSISYIAGSVLTNSDQNPNIEILGWLVDGTTALPVMGILHYPKSRIFFIGDMNGLQVMPQPFINNLIIWMGTGFE